MLPKDIDREGGMWQVMNVIGPAKIKPRAGEEIVVLEIVDKPISEVFPRKQEKEPTP